MDLFKPLDFYCERVGAHFWAEPFNAVSNAAFVVAAIWAWTRMNRAARNDGPLVAVVLLAGAIGIGSFLFHTFANLWSSFGDVGPIWIFVAAYLVLAVARFPDRRPGCATMLLVAAGAAAVAIYSIVSAGTEEDTGSAGDPLNGSLQYAPAWLALAAFAASLVWRGHPARWWVVGAAGVFTVSLAFRTVDPAVCEGFPLGTHFLWHLLNGLMIGLLLQALIAIPRRSPAA